MNVIRSDKIESDAIEASSIVVEALQLATNELGLALMELFSP
jgi:hypothetical protein